jgi:hypothetical protein
MRDWLLVFTQLLPALVDSTHGHLDLATLSRLHPKTALRSEDQASGVTLHASGTVALSLSCFTIFHFTTRYLLYNLHADYQVT